MKNEKPRPNVKKAPTVQDQAVVAFQKVNSLTVKTAPDRQAAADLWDAIRAFRKQEEERKKQDCDPLKAAWEAKKAPFDAFINECKTYEARLQIVMAQWDREQVRLALEQQESINKQVEAQNAKIQAKADAQGVQALLKVPREVDAPQRVIPTQAGMKQVRQTVKRWKIKDLLPEQIEDLHADHPLLTEMPRDLLKVDVVLMNQLVKLGRQPACVEVYDDYQYSQR